MALKNKPIVRRPPPYPPPRSPGPSERQSRNERRLEVRRLRPQAPGRNG
jgi:hypothetical protein